MIVKYGLIVENNKELSDFIDILNEMSLRQNLLVRIVCLAKIYQDHSQFDTIKKINFPYELLVVENIFHHSFTNLSTFNKVKLVLRSKYKIFNFIKDVNILLSGIQTVFERVLYSQIQKKELPIKTVVYHRHLLFDDGVNTRRTLKNIRVVKSFLSFLGLDGLFLDVKAIGYGDCYIVLGEVNRNYLLSQGVSSEKIYPLGSLEYDNICLLTLKNKEKNKKICVCYITSAYEWIRDFEGEAYQQRKIKEYCEYFSNKLDKFDVWIRVHPREPIGKYEAIKEQYVFINLQFIDNGPLLVSINQFDLLIGGMSTALFEANLLKKSIVFFILGEELYRYRKILDTLMIIPTFSLANMEVVNKELNAISFNHKVKSIEQISNFLESLQ